MLSNLDDSENDDDDDDDDNKIKEEDEVADNTENETTALLTTSAAAPAAEDIIEKVDTDNDVIVVEADEQLPESQPLNLKDSQDSVFQPRAASLSITKPNEGRRL